MFALFSAKFVILYSFALLDSVVQEEQRCQIANAYNYLFEKDYDKIVLTTISLHSLSDGPMYSMFINLPE